MAGKLLAQRADAVLPIRTALIAVNDLDLSTWAAVWKALEAVPAELRSDEEVTMGWEEVRQRSRTFSLLLLSSASGPLTDDVS